MSQTWGSFVANTLSAYWTGAQDIDMEDAAIRAVADYVKSRVIREVDADIPLAKSYESRWEKAKLQLAGYTLLSALGAVQEKVKALITVDGVRAGISETDGFIDLETANGVNELNGLAVQANAHLIDAVVEIQRKAPRYKAGLESTYLKGGSGVTTSGFVTKVALSSWRDITAVRYGDYYAPLAASTAYAVDDLRTSNGRVYKCVTAGTTAASLGAGLVETDGTTETIGTAGFEYYSPTNYRAARRVSWEDRYALLQNLAPSSEPLYAVNPGCTELWIYPEVDADHAAIAEWRGLATSFVDSDIVSFDQPCESACAEYIRAMLQKNVGEDARASGASYALWQQKLKHIWLDL